MRRGVIERQTTETSISIKLTLDGRGRYDVRTGIRFLDHMLELFTRHGGFDLRLRAEGDLDVDQHHTVEDIGIALGEAVEAALGSRRGINRAGYFVMPMDESIGVVAIDLGGRAHAVVDARVSGRRRSATCRPSCSPTSSRASRAARAPTCTSRCSTAAPITTRSRRSSRRSDGHCAWPVRATGGSRR